METSLSLAAIKKLLTSGELTPKQLRDLEKEISKDTTEKTRSVAKRLLVEKKEELFSSVYPIVEELDGASDVPTFAGRILEIVKRMRKENALLAFRELSDRQQREVLRHES